MISGADGEKQSRALELLTLRRLVQGTMPDVTWIIILRLKRLGYGMLAKYHTARAEKKKKSSVQAQ